MMVTLSIMSNKALTEKNLKPFTVKQIFSRRRNPTIKEEQLLLVKYKICFFFMNPALNYKNSDTKELVYLKRKGCIFMVF